MGRERGDVHHRAAGAPVPELRTERLLLRAWSDADLEPFAELNADPLVMRHFPSPLSRAESDAFVSRARDRWSRGGPCFWAVEVVDGSPFIGFVGLAPVGFSAAFTPCVEVGWRLSSAHWGQGYAPEAARAALAHGFTDLGLEEIVSFTTPANTNSRRVMTKIGMTHDPADDFDHPTLPAGHPLERHVLYRIRRNDWMSASPPG